MHMTCVTVCLPFLLFLQLLSSQARVMQLEDLHAEAEASQAAAAAQAAHLAAEHDAAARNLLRAEAELNDVSDYSTKMFRQVRVRPACVCVSQGRACLRV
jgi:hypothetical protein